MNWFDPTAYEKARADIAPEPFLVMCRDGVRLGAHLWPATGKKIHGTVIIAPATGVLARYYHFYAAFLAAHGFDSVTFDYRGIGLSRPVELRRASYSWRDWGEIDLDAVIAHCLTRSPSHKLFLAGHSIGGFLPGFSLHARHLHRILTVGAQYAHWRSYKSGHRARLALKWHVAMPLLTAACGYFPGRRLGWLEDLPAGVAYEWSFRRAAMEKSYPEAERGSIIQRFNDVSAEILAVTVADDELAPAGAVSKALSYYGGAAAQQVLLAPEDLGASEIGHFGLFHNRHANGFWLDTLLWLREGINPWPAHSLKI